MNSRLGPPVTDDEEQPYINMLQFIAIDVVFFIAICVALHPLGYPWYLLWLIGSFVAPVISLIYCAICFRLIDAMANLNFGHREATTSSVK